MPTGKLITIEGLDGAGKSTLAIALAGELTARGLRVELLREPGGAHLSERIRELVKDPSIAVHPRAEALLYAAARAQLVQERIAPSLAAGTWVLLDRYIHSSLAYQGAARNLGIDHIATLNAFATGGLAPDRTLLLRIAPDRALLRLHHRGTPPDRLEGEGERFFACISSAYDQLARTQPHLIRTIDAEQPPSRVLELALASIGDLLPPND
ncbi:MAG TPA: dTMP kinase [Solirubrobacteraceae bacterium]|jgi:dTMP kinase